MPAIQEKSFEVSTATATAADCQRFFADHLSWGTHDRIGRKQSAAEGPLSESQRPWFSRAYLHVGGNTGASLLIAFAANPRAR